MCIHHTILNFNLQPSPLKEKYKKSIGETHEQMHAWTHKHGIRDEEKKTEN